jgi:hypothetical protein
MRADSRRRTMRRELLILVAVLLFSGLVVVGPSMAGTATVFGPYDFSGTPPAPPAVSGSDVLWVQWDSQYGYVTIGEGGGENVTDNLSFDFSTGALTSSNFSSTNAYLIEPGTVTDTSTINGYATVIGDESDTINFNTNTGGLNASFNMNSDQAGRGNSQNGVLETSDYVDITHILFTDAQYKEITDAGHTVQVLAYSDEDVVPIPPSILLMGSGLLGLVGLRRLRKG